MKISKLIWIIVIAVILGACEKVFDKQDLEGIPEKSVWNDVLLARAYVDELYDNNLPQWNRSLSDRSDESDEGEDYMHGQLTENSVNHWPYSSIRDINILITNIDDGTIEEVERNRLKGEALFFRALRYFEMVRLYGGVPLLLEPQKITDDILVERAPTSVVMQQIISDLDDAIAYLPAIQASSGANDGHLHKGTAMAMKGRILLYYASPQFDPDQNTSGRWQEAYDANKAAKAQLVNDGYGLYDNFGDLWYDEMNKEVIFVSRYEYPAKPDPTHYFAGTRPLDMSVERTGWNQPVLEMVDAFPMKDGRAIDDPTSTYTYDSDYYWLNRDPRLDKTIVRNGSLWELSGITGRIQWTFDGAESNSPTETGYYCRKAVNPDLDIPMSYDSPTDYVDLRFAEVLMNLAEAANKIGNTNEAYNELIELRDRAGIDSGSDNMYGLKAGMSVEEMHEAILHERKIEFAFEGKRHWDLRRNRLFEKLLNGTRRQGHSIELLMEKDDFFNMVKSMTTQEVLDLMNTNYTDYFEHHVINRDLNFPILWRPEYYFYAIPEEHLRLNSRLEQTIGWAGGTFDPLQ
jgi:starch-binding outer membrane protein, SusD/RagB family